MRSIIYISEPVRFEPEGDSIRATLASGDDTVICVISMHNLQASIAGAQSTIVDWAGMRCAPTPINAKVKPIH